MGELNESIKELLDEGRTPMQVRMDLVHRGFLEDDVDRALNVTTASKRYVTGLKSAIVDSHPVSASSGRNVVVRNANGKNSRKLELTAAGLPVFSAIA